MNINDIQLGMTVLVSAGPNGYFPAVVVNIGKRNITVRYPEGHLRVVHPKHCKPV